MPYYHWYELTHAALSPARAVADATRLYYKNPLNPLTHTSMGRGVAAMMEVFERVCSSTVFTITAQYSDGPCVPSGSGLPGMDPDTTTE